MTNKILYILILFNLIIFVSCKKENQSENTSTGGIKSDRFILPSLPGDYVPKGLNKVSIIEMKKIGEEGGIPSGIVFRDNKGNIVSSEYYSHGPEPRFVQFYANSAGKVEEAVVHEMTPEIKAIMLLMRIATMPLEN